MLTCKKFPVLRAHISANLSTNVPASISANLSAILSAIFIASLPVFQSFNAASAGPTSASSPGPGLAEKNQVSSKSKPPEALDGKNSFRLMQHYKPSGEEEIWVSPAGIRILNLRNRYVTLFPKPYTVVHAYSNKTKKIFHCSIKDYKSPYGSSMALLKSITFSDIKTSKYKEATYKGCSATYSNIPNDVMLQRLKDRSNHDLVGRSPRLFEIVTSSKLVVAPAAVSFLCRYYGLPQKTGLPLDMQYETFGRQKHQYLTTDKIEAKTFKPGDFSPPTNFTLVKKDGELLLDEDSEDSMKMMIMDH